MIKFKPHKKSEISVLSEKIDNLINYIDDNKSKVISLTNENEDYIKQIKKLKSDIDLLKLKLRGTNYQNHSNWIFTVGLL